MLKLVSFISFLFLLLSAGAQNHHFVYFESQNNKPFFIKYDNKIYNSTKKNYINISKLNSGDILIKVDIEKERDLSFTISLNDNDAGFVLKQNDNNDWVLFNITDFTTLVQDKFIEKIVANPLPQIIEPITTIEVKKINEPKIEIIDSNKTFETPHSSLVPKAILLDSSQITTSIASSKIDSNLNKQTLLIQEAPISLLDSSKILITTVKNENAIDTIKESITKKSVQESLITTNSIFEKVQEVINSTGVEQKYIDKNAIEGDTINIFIPYKKEIKTDTVKEVVKPFVEEKKMVSNNIDHVQLTEVNCLAIATEYDYNNFIAELQKNPVIKNKLVLASTVLQKKCYTTSQIQKLSVLFMYDKAKLDFFKMAINSVADIKNFHYLENEIKDQSMRQEFLELLKP